MQSESGAAAQTAQDRQNNESQTTASTPPSSITTVSTVVVAGTAPTAPAARTGPASWLRRHFWAKLLGLCGVIAGSIAFVHHVIQLGDRFAPEPPTLAVLHKDGTGWVPIDPNTKLLAGEPLLLQPSDHRLGHRYILSISRRRGDEWVANIHDEAAMEQAQWQWTTSKDDESEALVLLVKYGTGLSQDAKKRIKEEATKCAGACSARSFGRTIEWSNGKWVTLANKGQPSSRPEEVFAVDLANRLREQVGSSFAGKAFSFNDASPRP